jgi:hypothetical protein
MVLFATLVADASRFDILREFTRDIASESALKKSRKKANIR